MTQAPRDFEDATPVKIRRGRVESVDLYEIKDSELDQLEKGSPADLQLNFSIFLLSTAFAAICSLATATFSNATVREIFLILAVGGLIGGAFLGLSWIRNRVSNREICQRIRSRIPPEIPRESDADAFDEPAGDVDPAEA